MNDVVDRNGMRAGAGLSAVLLLVGFLLEWTFSVPAIAVALLIGGLFGPKTSPLSVIYRSVKRAFSLKIAVEPEPAAPPRFAQALGAVFLIAATAALFSGASDAIGWGLALLVAALQALLAATGICIGCEMYLLGKRLTTKSA